MHAEIKRNCIQAAESKANSKQSTLYGSARWATRDELFAAGYLAEPDSGRFIVGRTGGELITIPKNLTEEHVLVCGPTGAGKTRTIFIPNLVRRLDVSALVTEAASGENPPPLYTRTAGLRASAGHEIHYFNPSDLRSTRINPLDSIGTFDEANHVCVLIIKNTSLPNKFGGDQIWEQSEIYLLNALILYVLGLRKGVKAVEGDGANLANIRTLLRHGPDEIGKLIADSPIELARKEYNSFYKNTSPNFRYGVCSGLLVRLNPWVNPKIAALTEVTDFDIEALKRKLFTFYFVTSTKRPQFKPVAALAFNHVFDLLQAPGFDNPMTLFLDELTNYGYIPDLPEKLTHIRNQQIGAVLGIQHHIQLSKVYQEKDAQLLMTQPGTRIFFRPRDIDSAMKISRSLGNATVVQRKVVPGSGIHEDERQRPLLDPSEVERMAKSKIIVLTPTTNPVMVDTFHPIEHDVFCELPPPEREELEIDERLARRAGATEGDDLEEEKGPEYRSSSQEAGTDQDTIDDDLARFGDEPDQPDSAEHDEDPGKRGDWERDLE
ncbi:MAG: type IV secretory system conjugative DNA transfer family protein [Candidatus Obscuribacterales bacterium]|nr:type IV secretory system conjugative DNA transfer family protein [Candidatus Obscuribacterales bacterium]